MSERYWGRRKNYPIRGVISWKGASKSLFNLSISPVSSVTVIPSLLCPFPLSVTFAEKLGQKKTQDSAEEGFSVWSFEFVWLDHKQDLISSFTEPEICTFAIAPAFHILWDPGIGFCPCSCTAGEEANLNKSSPSKMQKIRSQQRVWKLYIIL